MMIFLRLYENLASPFELLGYADQMRSSAKTCGIGKDRTHRPGTLIFAEGSG